MSDKAQATLLAFAIAVLGTSALIGGIALADGGGGGSPAQTPVSAAPMAPGAQMASASGSVAVRASQPGTTELRIVHVQQGCHTFAFGNAEAPDMTLHMQRGQTLDMANLDVDPQHMVQFEGPMMMAAMPATAMVGGHMAMAFPEAGTYRFTFDQQPMAGEADAADDPSNPDNTLTLAVQVS